MIGGYILLVCNKRRTHIPTIISPTHLKTKGVFKKQLFKSAIGFLHLKTKKKKRIMSQYKKKPERGGKKDNLGFFMVTDPEQAVRDVKKKEAEKEKEEEQS
jgi:hypothetical protein